MPFLTLNRMRHFYRLEGNPVFPVLMLSHSIGTDHGMWAPQAQDLLTDFRILRHDTRGHGASDAPSGEYSIEQLGSDAVGIADALKISEFAFCGLSMGGALGQWLALHFPRRVRQLILANTAPRFGTREFWNERIRAVQQNGMAAIVDTTMQRFFSAGAVAQSSPEVGSIRSVFLGTDPMGYAGCCAALRDLDFTQQLRQITVPTLVIVGERDISTPWEGNGEILVREIPNARAERLPAAHLSNLESPKEFSAALLSFLQPQARTM